MKIIGYIFAIIFLSVIDGVWITFNKSRYNRLVSMVQGSQMKVNLVGALIAYPLMYVGLVFIVFKLIEQDRSKSSSLTLSLKYGALFGFIVYGIFNATNYAMFSNYNWLTGIIDTLWGTFAYFITTYVTLQLF
jgi:uncharacterized membrane protein